MHQGGGQLTPDILKTYSFFSWKCSVGLYQIVQFYFWKCKSTLMTSSVARTPFTPFCFWDSSKTFNASFPPPPPEKYSAYGPEKLRQIENRKI